MNRANHVPQHGRRLRVEPLEPRQLLAVVVNEIHYDPDVNTEQVEFIELYNTGPAAVDLSDWRIDEAVDFTFPNGAQIAAGGYLVVAQDSADFQTKFGFAPFGQWETGDKLSNEGETIELRDAANGLVDVVSYRPGFPWPTTGEYGSSLELLNPNLDNDLAGSWRTSGLTSDPNAGQPLVTAGSSWRYRKGITADPPSSLSNPANDWRMPEFVEANDAVAWQDGAASIGYGDGDDATVLGDMRDGYSSFYARQTFTLAGAIPNSLNLRVYVDDGAIVYINGVEVVRVHTSPGDKHYNSVSGQNHEAIWEDFTLSGMGGLLVNGVNVVAVHVLNGTIDSSDASFNLELSRPDDTVSQPTPGAANSVFSANAPPQLRQLSQSIQQPTSGQDVVISIKATDPDGVQGVTLDYQLVDPGAYIRISDAAYEATWTTIVMHDDGLNGDAVAGDDVYSATLSGSLQTHRRLVRYRIVATDALGAAVSAPYADDPQANFAYFVYDGVPDYAASLRPGVEPAVVYAGDKLDDVATYHLIADAGDVQKSQYNPSYNEVLFRGTLVYDGIVYDNVEFRNRGVASTYAVGKNKWKIEFLRGHYLQARDNYGRPYGELWDEINILPGTNPWWRDNASTDGTVLFEPAAFKLYELAGAPSPGTSYLNFRVIDDASETGANQYGGDYWGLYIGIEQPDGSFLDERDLPDGNLYNMHQTVFGATTQRHQGAESPTDRSDLAAFLSGIDGGYETLEWWQTNLNWDAYFAWNIVNHVVNNSDIRPNENVNYYRNETTGQWYVIPWDLDLTFEDAPHLGTPVTTRENIRTLLADHPLAKLAYNNRLREISDLLLENGDAAKVIEELAGVLTLGTEDPTIVDANQAMWDYHPQKVKKGIWYENFNPALLTSESFAGLVDYLQDFVSPGGYGYNLLQTQGSNAGIPDSPSITYVGDPGFAIDQLSFTTTDFNDRQDDDSFAAIQWRIAEILNPTVANYSAGDPYIYEIEGTWDSGELTTFASQLDIPATALEPGKTYRARVRMQDTDGNWSHWSAPVEFLTASISSAPTLVISEINYHPAEREGVAESGDLEFIEVLNVGAATVDLTGIQLTQFAAEPYVFDAGLSLGPGERIVVARSPQVFQSVYGTEVRLAPTGYGTANLSNGGETVGLATAAGLEFFAFTYDDDAPWPAAADGNGPSLEIVDPLGDPTDPSNWRASLVDGGTPGGPLAGDYQQDGRVNGSDFLLWQRTLGTPVATAGAGADGDFSRVVDAADLDVWMAAFGGELTLNAGGTSAPLSVELSSPASSENSNQLVTAAVEAASADVALAQEIDPVAGLTARQLAAISWRYAAPLELLHPETDANFDMRRNNALAQSTAPASNRPPGSEQLPMARTPIVRARHANGHDGQGSDLESATDDGLDLVGRIANREHDDQLSARLAIADRSGARRR
ncbi:MAG: lamin tail domain-containing protein [Planctomycetales bacterium]|nr:lamin tail domain-containing protein [Planctomycetales bacterium]